VLIEGNDGGVSKSFNGGTTWFSLNGSGSTGLVNNDIFGFDITSKFSDRIVVGQQDNQGLYKSNGNWSAVTFGNGDGEKCVFNPQNPNIFYQLQNCWIKRCTITNNDVSSCTTLANEPVINCYQPNANTYLGRPLIIDPVNPNILYTGRSDGYINKTMDAGNSWQSLDVGGCGKAIMDIAIAPSDHNIIYAITKYFTWDLNPIEKSIFRSEDAGQTWVDITNNLPNIYAPATDIAIDPYNPNRVWVTMGGIWLDNNNNPMNRVFMTEDARIQSTATWINMTYNLSALPVTAIVYQQGSDDRVFVGTDAGIFYWDKSNYEWKCFSTGLPISFVTELKINYCSNEIYASSWGRGMYKSQLPFITYQPTIINTNTLWTGEMYQKENIIIENNATLNITGIIYMATDKKIIVQPGAKLIIDGGKITCVCGLWQGIEVQGNPTLSQNPVNNQGVVEIINGGTIENALVGIFAPAHKYAIDPVTTGFGGGGIIKATDAVFRNCEVGVRIDNYHNFNPITHLSLPNRSYFKKCLFETTNSFISGSVPSTFIYLDNVEGVNILGNTFQNTNTSMPSYDRGKGIQSYDANYSVKPFCNSLWVPCPPTSQIPNNFTNLVYGINSSNINTTKSVFIDNNV